ncbi:MAG: MBL fold metallo-hydrolase [Clostridia bacterium]|nr:MBL fold metallo-hydrolase [Clostridia bacterium]
MNIKITDVRAIPGDSAFLLDDGKTAILYDSGFAFTGYAVADNIKKELGDRALDYIFLTHSHYDHALGSVYAREYWPDAKVVAGSYAAQIFEKPSAKAVMRDLDRKFADKCGVGEYTDLIDGLKVDIPVSEGDIIRAGDMSFTAVDLPGHTRCSVGYYLAEEKLLLGSETIGVFDGESTVVPSYLVGYEMTLNSIEKVERMDVEHILVPHYGILDKEKTALYLQNAKVSAVTTARDITEILKGGGSHEDALNYFKDRFYHGYIKEIYPVDAMELNTSITVKLIEKELL